MWAQGERGRWRGRRRGQRHERINCTICISQSGFLHFTTPGPRPRPRPIGTHLPPRNPLGSGKGAGRRHGGPPPSLPLASDYTRTCPRTRTVSSLRLTVSVPKLANCGMEGANPRATLHTPGTTHPAVSSRPSAFPPQRFLVPQALSSSESAPSHSLSASVAPVHGPHSP